MVSHAGDRAVLRDGGCLATLRGRITFVSIVAVTFVAVALGIISQSGQRRTFERLSTARQASDRLMFEKILSYHLKTLEERLIHIISPPLVQALRYQEVDRLREHALPPFNRLSSLINMTKLSFYRESGTPILNVHADSSKAIPTAPRALISEAFSRRAIRTGLECRGNEIDLSVAGPAYSDGTMVGVVAVSGGLKPILEEFKRTLDADLVFVANDTQDGSVQVLVHTGDVLPANVFGLINAELDGGPARTQAGTQVRIFKPFSQVDGSPSRKFGGLGIGLAISRALCELMGGRLDLETQTGAGTTVTILLPRVQRTSAPGIGCTT